MLELHDFFQIFSDTLINPVTSLMDKIMETHSLVHIHCNNSSRKIDSKFVKATDSLECTFVRNDFCTHAKYKGIVNRDPKSFDCPNNPNAEDIQFQIKF